MNVALGHMVSHAPDPAPLTHPLQSCMVEADDDGRERVTFLYKFVEGACPRSYGFNVAAMAGVPEQVVALARHKSAQFENHAIELQAFR